MSKLLVTTAIENSWGNNEEIIFLGEWCKLFSRKKIWNQRESYTMPYHWCNSSVKYNDYLFLKSYKSFVLTELSKYFNNIHGVNYPIKFWDILIGHWLMQFLTVALDRWKMVKIVSERYKDMETIFLKSNDEDFVPENPSHAFNLYIDDEWNHHFFKLIINRFNNLRVKQCNYNLSCNLHIKKRKFNYKLIFIKYLKEYLLKNRINNYKYEYDNSINFNVLYKLSSNIKLYNHKYKCCIEEPVKKTIPRKSFKFTSNYESNKYDDYQSMISEIIIEFIPFCYIEKYKVKNERINSDGIISYKKHFYDEQFKRKIAENFIRNKKILIFGHGSAPHQLYNSGYDYESSISDVLLVSGSGKVHSKNHIISGRINSELKLNKFKSNGQCTVVQVGMPRYAWELRSMAQSSQIIDYLNDQFKFYENLSKEVTDKTKIKLYPRDYGWNIKERLIASFDNVKFSKFNISKEAKKSRLLVYTYSASSYIESLIANVPTVLFWDKSTWAFAENIQSDFNKLEKAEILFYCPQKAAYHINHVWPDVKSWWFNSELQKCRIEFVEKYASTLNLKNILKTLIN